MERALNFILYSYAPLQLRGKQLLILLNAFLSGSFSGILRKTFMSLDPHEQGEQGEMERIRNLK